MSDRRQNRGGGDGGRGGRGRGGAGGSRGGGGGRGGRGGGAMSRHDRPEGDYVGGNFRAPMGASGSRTRGGGGRGASGGVSISSSGRGGQHFSNRGRVMRESELQQLELDVDRGKLKSNELLMRLVDERSGFENLIGSEIKSPQLFATVAQLSAKAVEEDFSPQLKIKLLTQLMHSKLFDDSLRIYLTQLPLLLSRNEQEWQTVGFVLQIQDACFETTPQEAYNRLQAPILVVRANLKAMRSLVTCPSFIDEKLDDLSDKLEEMTAKQLSMQLPPDALEAAARAERFQQPPQDFRELTIIPTREDLAADFKNVFLQANRVKGSYPSAEVYLDTQFRLMREDLVEPLRRGLAELRKDPVGRRRIADIRVYNNVKVRNVFYCSNDGISYAVQLDTESPNFRRTNWSVSKRLIYGSLVCLSCDSFQTLYFATVQDRRSAQFEHEGILKVLWVNQPDEWLAFSNKFVMIETTAFFESYRHVLETLKDMDPARVPFSRYLVECQTKVRPPQYLQFNATITYDFRPIMPETAHHHENLGKVHIQEDQEWPTMESIQLDDSQYAALKTALRNELAIIQGPPGTGKTHLGLRIAQMLVHNIQSRRPNFGPILLVCYTNHALDQFLEGILGFVQAEDAVRVGGRCQSAKLEGCLLYRKRRTDRIVYDLRTKLHGIEDKLGRMCIDLDLPFRRLIKFHLLYDFILPEHLASLEEHAPEHIRLSAMESAARRRHRAEASDLDRLSELFNLWILSVGVVAIEEVELSLDEALAAEDENIDLIEEFIFQEAYEAAARIVSGDDRDDDNENDDNVRGEGDFEFDVRDASHGLLSDRPGRREEMEHSIRAEVEREKAVDIGNCVLVDQDGFQTVFDQRRQNRQIEHQLQIQEAMPEQEAREIVHIWSLDENSRWQLYRRWRKLYLLQQGEKIEQLKREYNQVRAQLTEAVYECDRRVFEASRLVAMTTTGAARYRRVLRQVQPKIVIVEEAAEVLESHVLASLSPGCQHLVLIGDHKQLKPNPAVYELAKKYNLDVSLFERLVNNRVHYDTLVYQHRMRPEIAKLMQHIYPGLQDHVSVLTYPDVMGMSSNLFFMNHKQHEDYVEEMRSRSNQFESEMVVQLACHLVKQGYSQSQITVLTLYSGQLLSIKRLIPKFPLMRGVRVCVCDNYQGEENDIIILSLVRSNDDFDIGFLKTENRVCVALSRAKRGLYAVGNFDLLAESSRLWRRMVDTVAHEPGCYGDALRLACQNHPDEPSIEIREPADFRKSPEGGCNKPCGQRMPCGHVCKKACHPTDKEHAEVICKMPCPKSCSKGHPCPKRCHEQCKCTVREPKRIPKCGHTQMVECWMPAEKFTCQEPCTLVLDCGHLCSRKCGEPHSYQCLARVERRLPCQHMASIACSENSELFSRCQQPCGAELACGHRCKGRCGLCNQGRLHVPCREPCERVLVCGHVCRSSTCHQACPPCQQECLNACRHNKCRMLCGDACVPCNQPCDNRCPHGRCTRKCHERCDRDPCNEPCSFKPKNNACKVCKTGILECIGLCGERSHLIVCRCCGTDQKFRDIFFGTEDEPDAKFIRLDTCGHVFEVTGLDHWMKTPSPQNEIVRKLCPLCKTPIMRASCQRYRREVADVEADIEQVRDRIAQQQLDLRTALRGLPSTVEAEREKMLSDAEVLAASTEFANWMAHSLRKNELNRFLRCGMSYKKERYGEAAQLQELRRLQLLTQLLQQLSKISSTDWFKEVNAQPVRHPETADFNDLPQLQRTRPLEFASIRMSIDSIRLLSWLEATQPLSEYSVQQAEDELFRLRALAHFAHLHHQLRGCTGLDEETQQAADKAMEKLDKLLKALTDGSRFNETRQKLATEIADQINELVKSVVRVTRLERQMIVKAMQLPSGHWFKCPRGHVYAIGDCGGANEVAACPECGATIGGENHQLAAGNAHAPEMDGSEHPAWSEAANQMMGNLQLYD
ncbi:hypothetical protein BOX15_Mlig008686g1 [Macrostomum lignano]|uniref:RZ-type domain-containing protein n=1 Tax=Macrostomum lignano TaxID=282301 RepID=A0A267FQV1_9PLAT|nr:hypothetical protein BOX15_Mlig008686g1 [Macrostomum lignano]